jgi:hypothetical protein
MVLIGFGPPQDKTPIYPLAILVFVENKYKILRNGLSELFVSESELDDLILLNKIQKLPKPIQYEPNKWPVIEDNRVDWINVDDVDFKRSERSKSMLEEGQSLLKTNPIKAIDLISRSALIIGVDIKSIYLNSDE